MSLIRPATPGFLVTLVATILLALVSFSVPLIKSVYFLKASLSVENVNGYITFGTLGYCLTVGSSTSCSNATVGYELDVNALVGNNSPIQIPQLVVKWLTYALVLHIVAFGLAAVAAIFGLLAHVREMSMSCFSSCISGFGATVALAAFIFDIALFFIAKSRMNSVQGGSASIGLAVWLTLVSWILLFFSGCFYGIGRCCIKRRSRDAWDGKPGTSIGANGYGDREHLRLDAVKAEADRKARQAQGEVGLPSFHEYDQSQPLKARVDGDEIYLEEDEVPYRDNQSVSTAGKAGMGSYGRQSSRGGYGGGGYVRAPSGTRAVDEYNNVSSYPPRPQRQGSTITQVTASTVPSLYPPSSNTLTSTSSPMPMSVPASMHDPSPNNYFVQDPYGPQAYGHVPGGNSYNPPTQQSYTPYDPYAAQPSVHNPEPTFNPDTYNSTAAMVGTSSQSPYANTSRSPVHQAERNYAVGGGAYGASTAPSPPTNGSYNDPYYGQYQGPSNVSPLPVSRSPPALDTHVVSAPPNVSPVKGPRRPRNSVVVMAPPPSQYDDSPPTYDAGPPGAPGQWGSKG
ncbi:pali-domain-containing protein [Paxillus ammoniavirescens]|nr:pali-domain-containing protein [Paxillus ammoniavirescens]